MYNAPFPPLTQVGWALAAVVLVLLGARAVRVEARTRRTTRPSARPLTLRLADLGVDAAAALAVVGFVVVLGLIVYSTYLGWMR